MKIILLQVPLAVLALQEWKHLNVENTLTLHRSVDFVLMSILSKEVAKDTMIAQLSSKIKTTHVQTVVAKNII